MPEYMLNNPIGSAGSINPALDRMNEEQNRILNNKLFLDNYSATDNVGGDNFDKWLAFTEKAAADGDSAALDKLFNYYASEKSNKTAREWTAQREDTQYQRLIEDLKKAGISPYIMSSAVPGVSSSSGNSYSGSQYTSASSNERTNATNLSKALMSLIGTAIFALMMV